MILVDTSIWIDHFRNVDHKLVDLLDNKRVLSHPFVIGELALGSQSKRRRLFGILQDLPEAVTVSVDEALHFIEVHGLAGQGIGYVDAHLLASAQLTDDARLWTRDKRLAGAAERLGLGMQPHWRSP